MPRSFSAVAVAWRPDDQGRISLAGIYDRVVDGQADIEMHAAVARSKGAITMADLLAAGLLVAGQRLELAISDDLPGRVRSDGKPEVNGVVYDDPNASVIALIGLPVNYGWGPWQAPQADGSRPSLDDLRRELLRRRA